MNIFITGATGFIGDNLVRSLIGKGHRVKALVRGSSELSRELKEMGVIEVRGDLGDKDLLVKTVSDVETVFHLAGVLGKFGIPDEVYFQTHVLGTKNLLEACQKSPRLKQFIFCSTIGVLGPSRKNLLKEDDLYNPTNIYERTKVQAEKAVVSAIKNGFPATIIRPSLVYGPLSIHILQMFKSIQERKFFIIGKGNNLLHPVYINDLIQGFLLVLGNPRAIGRIYHIAGEEAVKLGRFFQVIADNLNVNLPAIKIPVWFASLVLPPLILLAKIFNFQPILTWSRLRFFTENRACSIEKAKEELGYQPKVNLNEGVSLSVREYKKAGYLK